MIKRLWLPAFLSGCVLVAACGEGGRASDSVRAAAAHEDSVRRFGASAWSEDELLAFMRFVSTTLAADTRLVNRRTHSVAVRTFGQQVGRQQREVGHVADSLLAGRTAMLPAHLNMDHLRAHEAEMRRLVSAGGFDSAYVHRVHATLTTVLSHLDRVEPERHTEAVGQLVTKNRMAMRTHLGKAAQMRTAFRRAAR